MSHTLGWWHPGGEEVDTPGLFLVRSVICFPGCRYLQGKHQQSDSQIKTGDLRFLPGMFSPEIGFWAGRGQRHLPFLSPPQQHAEGLERESLGGRERVNQRSQRGLKVRTLSPAEEFFRVRNSAPLPLLTLSTATSPSCALSLFFLPFSFRLWSLSHLWEF